MNKASFIGIARHRLTTDGLGVTTLACFWGCPLRCKYCINRRCFEKDGASEEHTPRSLYDKIKADDLYFRSTGGGVTFGGGEPLLYPEFLEGFSRLVKGRWRITLETSLSVSAEALSRVVPFVDEYIVDIKDTDPEIYLAYTGSPIEPAMNNLKRLLDIKGAPDITVRLPLIEGYNSEESRKKSEERLRALGVERIDKFKYTIK